MRKSELEWYQELVNLCDGDHKMALWLKELRKESTRAFHRVVSLLQKWDKPYPKCEIHSLYCEADDIEEFFKWMGRINQGTN